jgi:hypothetical protein
MAGHPALNRRALLAGLALPGAARAQPAASLVLLERQDCPWCRRWWREVGPAWDYSDLGARAPLRRVDVTQPIPEDLGFLRNTRFTPTFVLVAEGRELGRMIGYQGDLFFWQQAEILLRSLQGTKP